ncbi:Uncharacterized protein TCM_036723 [Theobroma cacao]|uniref:Uncharacterized protein n=1 Tax=Theobroma cacao TaxID=3641 RepID=A0A061FSJ5_THECC|nr:Uncharacterized protein TCM_036723 [Theobroma cacao]
MAADKPPDPTSNVQPVTASPPIRSGAHLYEKSALMLIAKMVRKPLYVDEATTNGTRLCGTDKLLGVRNTKFVVPIGSVGIVEPAIGLLVHKSMQTRVGEKIKGVPIELGEHCPINEQGVNEMRVSTEHIRVDSTVARSQEKIKGYVDDPPNLESTLMLLNHNQCLDVSISFMLLEVPILVTIVYATCTRSERILLWDCMRELSTGIQGPWLVRGDFNVILKKEDRLYGVDPHGGAMEDFATTLLDCGFVDGGFEGNLYTWTNNHMFQRLDRVVYNHHWLNLLPITRV